MKKLVKLHKKAEKLYLQNKGLIIYKTKKAKALKFLTDG